MLQVSAESLVVESRRPFDQARQNLVEVDGDRQHFLPFSSGAEEAAAATELPMASEPSSPILMNDRA